VGISKSHVSREKNGSDVAQGLVYHPVIQSSCVVLKTKRTKIVAIKSWPKGIRPPPFLSSRRLECTGLEIGVDQSRDLPCLCAVRGIK